MVMRFLAAMALKKFLQGGALRCDARALAGGIARIQNVDRNILLHRGQHSRWMQHLGAKVSQFRRLLEADDFDAAGIGAEVRIGGHHAIDIGPNFDAVGIEAGADDRTRIIRAAAADRGGDSGFGGADKAAHHGHAAGIQMRLHLGAQAFVGFLKQGTARVC